MKHTGHILVIDDNRLNRMKLTHHLSQQGHSVEVAENGSQGLEMLGKQAFDLVLLDIVMPELDGYQVLKRMKADRQLQNIPVIVISAVEEMDSVIQCIKNGAEDHLSKPFDPTLLQARIGACLEKKKLRDQEQLFLEQLQSEKEKSERLLLNILPAPIAERLKRQEEVIADSFEEVTVLFADIVGFTGLSARVSPQKVVILLNEIFSMFDQIADRHRLEKIKTIGDAYMVVGGLPAPRPDHAQAIADMALDMKAGISDFNEHHEQNLSIRIGINTGPVVAGVIGTRKFSYDLWGDTVNVASRMESHGIVDTIQLTQSSYEKLCDNYLFEQRGEINVKGKGKMKAYLLLARR